MNCRSNAWIIRQHMDASSEQKWISWRNAPWIKVKGFHRVPATEKILWSLNWPAAVVFRGNGSELGRIIFYGFSRIRKYEKRN